MNLDVSGWKEFRVGDLFDIHPTKTIDGLNAEMCNGGKTPLVVNQSYNNGIAGFCDFEPTEKGGIITFSDTWEGNTFFYQPNNFIGFAHVQGMYPKMSISQKCLLFLCTMLDFDARGRFSYGRKKRRDIVSEIFLKLPTDTSGNPDWKFMENYVKSLHNKPLKTSNKPHAVPQIDITKWRSFVTERLFPVMKNGKANQQLLSEGDNCFYVGAKRDGNGVMLHCAKDQSLMTKGNCIIFICNGEGSVGYANYMDADFIGTTDIVAGYNDDLNPYIGLFLATVYSLERPKYSFGRKWKTHLKQTVVLLPVKHNSDGSVFLDKTHKYSDDGFVPDWQFMENYIKALPYGDRLKR